MPADGIIVRIRGWRGSESAIFFIGIMRTHTGAALVAAKQWFEHLHADGTLDLRLTTEMAARDFGMEILPFVDAVTLITVDNLSIERAEQLVRRPPLPQLACPSCHLILTRDTSECRHCGWLRFASERSKWKTSGHCGRCGFTNRWDGSRCSHCGFGAVEELPITVQPAPPNGN